MTQPSCAPRQRALDRKCWLSCRPSSANTSEQTSDAQSLWSSALFSDTATTNRTASSAGKTTVAAPTAPTEASNSAVEKKLFAEAFVQRHDKGATNGATEVLGRSILGTWQADGTRSTAWLQVSCRGARPPPRFGHTAVAYRGHLLVIFGGKGVSGCLNDLWVYDTTTQQWQQEVPHADSPMPLPRSGHAAVMRGEMLYVMGGGGTDENVDAGDLWCYCFPIREWTCVSPNISGCPVKGHTLHLLPAEHTGGRSDSDLLLCFGGLVRSAPVSSRDDGDGGSDTTNSRGSLVPTHNVIIGRVTGSLVRWTLLLTSGTAPCPRSFHVAEVVSGTALLVVFGGRTTKAHYAAHVGDPNAVANLPREHRNGPNVLLNDMHLLNAATGVWQKMDTFANTPPPRSCAASVFANGRLTVFAGGGRACEAVNYELDLLARRWRPVPLGQQPLCSCPTVTLIDGKLVMFGGCGPDCCLSAEVLKLSLLSAPVRRASAGWLHRLATDALLFAESPAGRCSVSKFARYCGEGRVTLQVSQLTRRLPSERFVPGWEFGTALQKMHERAKKDPTFIPPPLQLSAGLTPDGHIVCSMSYDARNPIAPAAFFSPTKPAPVPALPETHTTGLFKPDAVRPPRLSIRVASPAPSAVRELASPVSRVDPAAPAQHPVAQRPPAAAAAVGGSIERTGVGVRSAAGTHTFCSPRTPWLGLVTGASAKVSSAKSSPLSAVPWTTTTGGPATAMALSDGRSRWSSGSDSAGSSMSEESIAFIETAIGGANEARVVPSLTPTVDLVSKVCKLRDGVVSLRTLPMRSPKLAVEALEGIRGPFLVHRLLQVAQMEYRLASQR